MAPKRRGPRLDRVMGCRWQSRIYNFCPPHPPCSARPLRITLFFLSCRLPGRNNCFPPGRKEQNCLGRWEGSAGRASCKMSYSDSSKIWWYPMALFNAAKSTLFSFLRPERNANNWFEQLNRVYGEWRDHFEEDDWNIVIESIIYFNL